MCTNCLPYREGGVVDHEAAPRPAPGTSATTMTRALASALDIPLSRAQLLKGLGGGLAALSAGPLGISRALAAANPLPYVVLIVLDGARPEYFTIPGIPHVQSLLRNGIQYTNAFSGILESETPSAHVTISTGSEPRITGIPSFWWANAENVRISLFSPAKIRAGDMEKIVRQSGAPTLAHLVHAKAPNAKVVALSGSKYYAADAIGGPDADVTMYFAGNAKGQWAPTYIPGHVPPAGLFNTPGLAANSIKLPLGVENHLAMNLATQTFNQMRQQVTLINLPEFDWPLGHVDGGVIAPAARVKTLMQGFDRDLAALQAAYARAGVLDRTIFVLMADHGMMPLMHKIPQATIRDAVARAGTSVVSETYTSAVYLWLKDETKARQVALNLARLHNPYIQSVYARMRTKQGYQYMRAATSSLFHAATEPANQYLLNSFNGSFAPDVTIVFTEGVGCEPGGQASWKADHGGTSWESQHFPLIISGSGIRSGQVSSSPARLIDIAPTLLQAMGASHKGMQGIPLADALQKPPSWAVQWQKAANQRLLPVVTALQQQSRAELAAGR